jgi:hypothetical protein
MNKPWIKMMLEEFSEDDLKKFGESACRILDSLKIDNQQDRRRVMDALSESANQHLNLFVTAMLAIGVLLQEGQKNENDN